MRIGINKLKMELLEELVKRNLKKKYRGSFLGIIWTVLNPLLMMIILTIVFSNLFRFNIVNFPVYLLTGQIIFNFFAESTTQSMTSIIDNSQLIRKIYIDKSLFPLTSVIFSLVNTFFSIISIFIIVLITNGKISASYLLIPVFFFYLFLFSYGIGKILATLTVYFKDIMHLYSVFLLMLMYLTPIFYPVEIIPKKYISFIHLNPLLYYVNYFRDIIYLNKFPSFQLNLLCFAFGITAYIIGSYIFKKNENMFVLIV